MFTGENVLIFYFFAKLLSVAVDNLSFQDDRYDSVRIGYKHKNKA